MRRHDGWIRSRWLLGVASATFATASGCMLGPNFEKPAPTLQQEWMDPNHPGIQRGQAEVTQWWDVFNDPDLNILIQQAYENNPSLHAAAVRVLQAQAARGIAVGLLFPQQQNATGSASWTQSSENAGAPRPETSEIAGRLGWIRDPAGNLAERALGNPGIDNRFGNWDMFGLNVGWELDLFGRYRRGIESADAAVLATLANYDDVLVSLIAEVATEYVLLRTLEEQLEIVRQNLVIQKEGQTVVQNRRDAGTATELDLAQSQALVFETESLIPATEASIQQTRVALCTLLGLPPQDISTLVGRQRPIPAPPEKVNLGIPADLLRRRPDVRRAEYVLASQCANIGIAMTDLYPRFSLVGDIGLSAQHFPDLFRGNSFQVFAGPSVRWAILNYGRLENNVRVQDAAFQALLGEYESLVLRAQGEVERASAGLVGAQRQIAPLTSSVEAAARAVRVAQEQYKGGIADYIRVLVAQQFLISEQSRLVGTRGAAAQNLVTLYRALGGGWELREGKDLVPPRIKDQMKNRTNWSGVLDADRFDATAPVNAP